MPMEHQPTRHATRWVNLLWNKLVRRFELRPMMFVGAKDFWWLSTLRYDMIRYRCQWHHRNSVFWTTFHLSNKCHPLLKAIKLAGHLEATNMCSAECSPSKPLAFTWRNWPCEEKQIHWSFVHLCPLKGGNLVNNGIIYISTGAGFLPSTVSYIPLHFRTVWASQSARPQATKESQTRSASDEVLVA